MKRKKRSAKALVMDPLFRPRQEKSKKGKGSYARRPRHQSDDAGPFSFHDVSAAIAPETRCIRYTPGLRSAAGAHFLWRTISWEGL